MKARKIIPSRRWQTIALYSDSGGGKTTLGVTAPKPMFLDSNQGLLSIGGVNDAARSVDIFGMADLDAAYANFTNTGDDDWKGRFETAIFDHFDDIQGIILDEILEKALEKDDRREDAIETREYGILYNKLARYLRKFRRLPCHRVLICGATEDFETGAARPSLIGQMKDKLKYFVDHTVYLRVNYKTGARYLQLDPTEKWYAKTRARWLPREARKIPLKFNEKTGLVTIDGQPALTKLFDLLAAAPKSSSPPTVEK